MGNRKWTYEGCMHLGCSNTLTDLYLEKLGWVWDREEMDYVTEDEDLLNYTVDIDCYIGDILFVMDEDELLSKILASCNYNDEEELNNTIRVKLTKCLEQALPELSGDIKEEVRQVLLQSRLYESIKSKADEHVVNINLADKINKGVANTEWEGSRREFVDIIRRGLGVTIVHIKKRPMERVYKTRIVQAVNSTIRKELHNNGYTVGQAEDMVKGLDSEVDKIVNNSKWEYGDYGVELRLLILPKGLNGFDEDDRVYILTGDTYNYLKSNNVVY